MLIKEISVKSCMTKSKLTDYVINPYSGCQHGCKYCYAVFMKRFLDVKEDWGEFIYPKINCPELLKNELKKNPAGAIFMSSVTDCYSPIESKYQLTRKILQTINDSEYKKKFKIEILTKSALVERDFDLIKSLDINLGMSMNTLDAKASRLIEPFAAPPKIRLKVLKDAKAHGIRVYGFISPVIPGMTDLESLFKELSFCDYVWVELLNTRANYIEKLMNELKKSYPQSCEDINHIIKDPKEYYSKIQKQVDGLSKKYKLKVREVVVHQDS